jgi:hypothetical protein
MVAKVLAVFLTAVVIVDAKALPGAQKHEKKSKPKSEVQSAPPPAAQPTANVQQPATKSGKKSSPFSFTSQISDDQKKAFKETLKKMSDAHKIPDAEERKRTGQTLDKELHSLLGNDVYQTYRKEAAARHAAAVAKHKEQQGGAVPATPQTSPPAQAPTLAPAAGGGAGDSKPKTKKPKTKKPSSSTSSNTPV